MLDLREVVLPPAHACATAPALSLHFGAATFTVLAGAPGSGRGAFLRVLGLLDPPAGGEVLLEGRPTARLDEPARELLRNQRCGFLFAAPFLLPAMTVLENVAMPLFKISQVEPAQARSRTEALLEFVGLAASAQDLAETLPLFQQHCVSLARALANEPAVLVVESLDAGLTAAESSRFAALLRQAVERFGVAVIASAPADFASEKTDRVIPFVQGCAQSLPAGEGHGPC